MKMWIQEFFEGHPALVKVCALRGQSSPGQVCPSSFFSNMFGWLNDSRLTVSEKLHNLKSVHHCVPIAEQSLLFHQLSQRVCVFVQVTPQSPR